MKPHIPGRSAILVRARNHSAIRPTAVVAALIRASILPLLLVAALVFALPAQPVAAGPASISFSANVLTITGSGNPETVHLSVAGTNLSIRSSIGTSADAGAQGLGFQVSTAANVANTGSIAAANDVRRIDINGAAGAQSILLDGGTFPALTLGAAGDIETVTFTTAPSSFAQISPNAPPTPDLNVTAITAVTINQSVTTANNAPITISADDMTITAATNAGTGIVTLQQASTAGRAIDLGSNTAGRLGLTDGELDLVTAGVLRLGRSDNAGNIGISAGISPFGSSQLELFTAGAIQNNAVSTDITVARLAMTGGTGIGVSGSSVSITTAVTNLEAKTTTGGIQIQQNNGPLTIGGVNGTLQGLQVVTSGDMHIQTLNGSIALIDTDGIQAVTGGSTSGDIALLAGGATSDVIRSVNADAITAQRGSITVQAGEDIAFGAVGVNSDNDVRASGSVMLTAGRDSIVDGFADLAADDWGQNTGGSATVTAGRNIAITNAQGDSASIGANGSAGGAAVLTTGANGLLTLSAVDPAALFSQSSNVTVNADRVTISPSAGIRAVAGMVTIQPKSANWVVDLGSTTDVAASTLELSDAELDRVATPLLRIGDPSNVGNIRLVSQITAANYNTLSLRTAGAILDSTGSEQTDLVVPNFAPHAAGGIGAADDLDTQVSNLAFTNTAGGAIQITNSNPVTITAVDDLPSSSNSGGTTILIASAVTFAANTTSSGSFLAVATESAGPGNDVRVNTGVTVRSVSGTMNLRAGDLIDLQTSTTTQSDANSTVLFIGLGDLDGSGGATIRGTLAGSSSTVIGGVADDSLLIDFASGATLIGAVTYNGNGGTNAITLDDTGSATPRTYSASASAITRSSTPNISLISAQHVTIKAGNASDTLSVTSAATTIFTLSGGQPDPPTLPGDTLDTNLSGTTTPLLTVTTSGSGYAGSWTFGNRQPVNFSHMETILPMPSLSITKSDGITVATPGTITTYTISVSNNGTVPLSGAKVSDPLPGGISAASYTSVASGGASGNTASGSGAINDTLTLPPGGTVTYILIATINPLASGTLTNIASLLAPGGATATDSDILTPKTDLSITKSDGITVATPGTTTTYTIVVSNSGPSTASGAKVSDPLPGGISAASYTSVASGGASGNTASGSGTINDTLTLPPGGKVTYILIATIRPLASGTLANTASVTAPAGATDTNGANNTATDTDTLAPSYRIYLPLIARSG